MGVDETSRQVETLNSEIVALQKGMESRKAELSNIQAEITRVRPAYEDLDQRFLGESQKLESQIEELTQSLQGHQWSYVDSQDTVPLKNFDCGSGQKLALYRPVAKAPPVEPFQTWQKRLYWVDRQAAICINDEGTIDRTGLFTMEGDKIGDSVIHRENSKIVKITTANQDGEVVEQRSWATNEKGNIGQLTFNFIDYKNQFVQVVQEIQL